MPAPTMIPASGDRLLRFVGDRIVVAIAWHRSHANWSACLRTNLGRAAPLRDETIANLGGAASFAGASWRDVPMRRVGDRWEVNLPLTEVGFFHAKPYLVDGDGRQRWPEGEDLGISVHPDAYRTANTIYCAFPRMFGPSRKAAATREPLRDDLLAVLDRQGYTVIPPSGTLRDLCRELPHIVDRLGCRILHLLPVGPTPTTFARFGRFGSPYAQQDLTAIDPALVEFDKRTTAVDQFRELTAAAHHRGCRVFLDIVINHTGWGSTLMNQRSDWFEREPDGRFHSPGAWGTVWEDLVELDSSRPDLWEEVARSLITWCARGVDGFRCDAGYMVPLPAWQYITARVRQEFPDCVFLLEGLGGAWEATEALLTDGGMQWAYSELFQNYDAASIASYLDHCHGHAAKRGILVHYSETHDNSRLAAKGPAWSRFRNRLCALTSHAGAFGFTNGVEWLADEKLEVHQARGLRWGAEDNMVDELAGLNALLADHPCFFDDATLERTSPPGAAVYVAVRRGSGLAVLVLANPSDQPQAIDLPRSVWDHFAKSGIELLGQALPVSGPPTAHLVHLVLPPLACHALADGPAPVSAGTTYRRTRAQAAWAYGCLARCVPDHLIGPAEWQRLAAWAGADPARFLGAIGRLRGDAAQGDLLAALADAASSPLPVPVLRWTAADATRQLPVPAGHWLLVEDHAPFTVTVTTPARPQAVPLHLASVPMTCADGRPGHLVALPPEADPADQRLELVRGGVERVQGALVRLPVAPDPGPLASDIDGLALLTNGRGGMARLGADLSRICSKYDGLLAANLHPSAPCDRHLLVKRLRVWTVADGFVTPLDRRNLAEFRAGPPAVWTQVVSAGDGRTVPIRLTIDLLDGRNTVVIRCERPDERPLWGTALADPARVSLTIRLDLEDRSFHGETTRSPAAEAHFSGATSVLDKRPGFRFAPTTDRGLRAWSERGRFHAEPEWCTAIPHPIEASRGMTAHGDAWSPGWFEIPLRRGEVVHLVVDAEAEDPTPATVVRFAQAREAAQVAAMDAAALAGDDRFGRTLAGAVQAYLVRRGTGRTVIAGYPWFLDWGRDTFIAARGVLSAGLQSDVRHLLATFGRFEDGGTLPNLLNGDRAENRDTVDAPLWYAVVAEELAEDVAEKQPGDGAAVWSLDCGGRTLLAVIRGIACGYLAGTANGIRVDPASALVWSPPHFTWMDTNHPAGTPRTGYPIEIQVLWIRLLRCLDRLQADPAPGQDPWATLADRAFQSLLQRYWLRDRGWFADQLAAPGGEPAAQAAVDDALRPNQLFAISLGIVKGELARQAVAACERHLLIPGAIRSLAPLAVEFPLPIHSADGRLLNDPLRPYVGHYAGDEDSRRKPAYHNGTAWLWPYPTFCEAYALAWDRCPEALDTARTYLGAMDRWHRTGCLGHLPEIADGDAPHQERGCDAQAWSVTEALRVWKRLEVWRVAGT